jgi:para-aminobenzoate synthetase component I
MGRKYKKSTFPLFELDQNFLHKLLYWADQFNVTSCYLSNGQSDKYDLLVGIGIDTIIENNPSENAFDVLKSKFRSNKDWHFGYFGYELKNQVEKLQSKNMDYTAVHPFCFYTPLHVLSIQNRILTIRSKTLNPKDIFNSIMDQKIPSKYEEIKIQQLKNRVSKESYLLNVGKIKQHIVDGDVYELNYCQEFYQENVEIVDPLSVFLKLNNVSKAPFAAYQKIGDHYVLCSSPERFITFSDKKIKSQPIKGTAKRGQTIKEDTLIKTNLAADPKNKAENIMIVDLVRNDFAKSCKTGTIKVTELFAIHSFELAHQMISTIEGEKKSNIHIVEAIKNAFPMGSMTGAPKKIAMELIDHFENTSRGIYSGAIGYFEPNGECDFNVVIRSIIYNRANKYLSFQVGGAIVYDSIPELEYEECLIKAKGMLYALGFN